MAARDAHFLENSLMIEGNGQSTTRPYKWSSSQEVSERALELETHHSTYLKQVLLHPLHVVLVIAVVLLAILTTSLWLIPLALVGEVVLGSVFACSRKFRHLVASEMDPNELMFPAEHRAALMTQMSEEHRDELEHLEAQIGTIRENSGSKNEVLMEQSYDWALLLRGYADLAAAHQAHAAALAVTNRCSLLDELRALEKSSASCDSARLKELIERRQEIVHRRLACWDRNMRAMEEIEHQLATISNLIGLIHEKSMLRSQAGWVSEEVDRISEDLERQEAAMFELST